MSEAPANVDAHPAVERPGLGDLAWLALVILFIVAVLAVWGWWLAPR